MWGTDKTSNNAVDDDTFDDNGFHQETQLVLPGYEDPDDESDHVEETSLSQHAAQLPT